jgi:small-conductance mechanosensitive channel
MMGPMAASIYDPTWIATGIGASAALWAAIESTTADSIALIVRSVVITAGILSPAAVLMVFATVSVRATCSGGVSFAGIK